MSFDFAGTGSRPGLTGGDWLGAGINLLDTGITNLTNYTIAKQNKELQEDTNAMNESLMRESWARDDNAVQRRVADLKSAGLSPVLAAGSAAGNSGPIQLNSPQLNFRQEKLNPLAAVAAVQQIKGQVLDNQLKELGVRYYGLPDWLIGVQRVIGELPQDNVLRKSIENALSFLGGLGSDNPGVHYEYEEPTFEDSRKGIDYDVSHGVIQMLTSGTYNSDNVFALADKLSEEYHMSKSSILDMIFDAWDRNHGNVY